MSLFFSPGLEPSQPEPFSAQPASVEPVLESQPPDSPAAHGGPGQGGPTRRTFLASLVAVAMVSGLVASGTTYTVAMAARGAGQSTGSASTETTGGTLLSSTSDSLATIVARTTESVVTINVTETTGPFGQAATAVGSGIVVGSDGLILTNAHVISGASSIQVTLPNGQSVTGTVYGVSSTTDLAIVKVDATGLTAAALGNSSTLGVGQTVVAIGDPLGEFADSATAGIVSGLDRTITVQNETLTGLIQTDARRQRRQQRRAARRLQRLCRRGRHGIVERCAGHLVRDPNLGGRLDDIGGPGGRAYRLTTFGSSTGSGPADERDLRSAELATADLERAADEPGSLLHADQPHLALVEQLVSGR